jgi:hypothetical protein
MLNSWTPVSTNGKWGEQIMFRDLDGSTTGFSKGEGGVIAHAHEYNSWYLNWNNWYYGLPVRKARLPTGYVYDNAETRYTAGS